MTKTGRIKCIPEFIRKNNLDFVGLSKKNKKATGHNRGILDGFKTKLLMSLTCSILNTVQFLQLKICQII
jgi:hypothetical protein